MNIEAMAREAGDDWDHTRRDDKEFLAAFAAIVRAEAMREAAGICEAYAVENDGYTELQHAGEHLSAAILAAIDAPAAPVLASLPVRHPDV